LVQGATFPPAPGSQVGFMELKSDLLAFSSLSDDYLSEDFAWRERA
jgi:hypothetical protein